MNTFAQILKAFKRAFIVCLTLPRFTIYRIRVINDFLSSKPCENVFQKKFIIFLRRSYLYTVNVVNQFPNFNLLLIDEMKPKLIPFIKNLPPFKHRVCFFSFQCHLLSSSVFIVSELS